MRPDQRTLEQLADTNDAVHELLAEMIQDAQCADVHAVRAKLPELERLEAQEYALWARLFRLREMGV